MKRSLILSAALLALIVTGLPAYAQSSGWSTPVQLAGDVSSWFPDVAVGPDGNVHVVYSSSKPRENEVYDWDVLMYRVLRNGEWSPENDIASPGAAGSVARTSIAMGRDGRLHLLVRSDFRIDYTSAPYDQAQSAADWRDPYRVNHGDLVYYDELAIDSNNTLHVVWTEQSKPDPSDPTVKKTCPLCSELYYRRSTDGGLSWSTPRNVSEMPDGSDKPHIQVDSANRVHVAWDEGKDRFSESDPKFGAYRRSDDGGVTWNATFLFSLTNDAVQQTTLGLTGDGTPLVVYRSTRTDLMYYQVEQADRVTWSAPAPLPGVRARSINDATFDHYTMVTDGGGDVHLFFVGFFAGDSGFQGRPRLMHLIWNGRAWSGAETVVSNELYPEWPSATIENGNTIHLVWFTRREEDRYTSDHALYRVWYSSKVINAPAVTPLPQFTPTPTLLPTATPQPTPQPTLYPTLDPTTIARGIIAPQPKPEGAGVSLLILGGAPAVAIALAVWAVRRVRR